MSFGTLGLLAILLFAAQARFMAEGRAMLLQHAACSGWTTAVRLLLVLGVDPDGADAPPGADTAPLRCAAFNGRVATVKALLDAGADPDARCCAGETALQLAAMQGHGETVRLLSRAAGRPR